MTDASWKRLIERASTAQRKADELRAQAETEYERRYGKHPSDVDDDWWIDTIQGGGVDLQKIKQAAEEALRMSTS